MTAHPIAGRPETSLSIGEQSAHKPLRPFGSASIRYPVSEGIAQAAALNPALEVER